MLQRTLVLLYIVFSAGTSLDYCIVGAGPGGIQLAYYLQKLGLDYLILERNSVPGSFFVEYPRRRTLISINKRYTGETNTEFNMRHDWNSLLSDDPEMIFKHYSKDMFPHADTLLQYLQDYVTKFRIKVQYDTNVRHITPMNDEFVILTSSEEIIHCKYVVASTGISVIKTFLKAGGTEHVEGYDTVSHNPEDFEGQKVLILGKGNSAFETADMIYGSTAYVHLVSRDRVKQSWNTHYVGDLRGVNNNLLDTYQLKSLDALIERDMDTGKYRKLDDRFYYDFEEDGTTRSYGPYDKIINCMGFNFDPSPFSNATRMSEEQQRKKYPEMGWDFQSSTLPNLYFAGTITHGLDKRMSSGGFIHGFRYTSRALAHILAARNHKIRWPSIRVPLYGIVSFISRRLNEMSGPYQMFYMLVDVYVRYATHVELFTEIPHGMLHRLHELLVETRSTPLDMIVIRLEYGADYSKVGGDPFRADRVELDPFLAHTCNFIHPVLYHYTNLPHAVPIRGKKLRGYNKRMHLVEDLHTDFALIDRHIPALTNFLGTIWKIDLSFRPLEECLLNTLTSVYMPEFCRNPGILLSDVTREKKQVRVSASLKHKPTQLLDDYSIPC